MSFEKFGKMFFAFMIGVILLAVGGTGLWFAINYCPEYRFGEDRHYVDVVQLPYFFGGTISTLLILAGTIVFVSSIWNSIVDLFE